jgi:hypothetical protein
MRRIILVVGYVTLLGCGPLEPPCLERAAPIKADNQSALERAEHWTAKLPGEHAETLAWRDGTTETVTLTFGTPEASWVNSRRNPEDHTDIGVDCDDRVRMTASLSMTSSEGRLREHLERVALDEDPNGVLRALFVRKASALAKGYVIQAAAPSGASSSGKFSGVQFALEFGPDGLRGDLYEEFRQSDGVSQSGGVARIGAAATP